MKQNIETIIDSGGMENIPLEAIKEARHSLANENITLKLALEDPSLMNRIYRKRVERRILKTEEYVNQIDDWLKEVEK